MPYDPPRQANPNPPKDPLEIELAFNVRPCGTCSFFWPDNSATQPYGPYAAYDFNTNFPVEKTAPGNADSFVWIQGTTRPPTFPDAEIMDGCRKAPIMTIGINPNLTAFGPGTTGASWCYPSFSSANGTDSWSKYAYYYRYRSVYQEHLDLKFCEGFLLPDGQIKASAAGVMQEFIRANDSPAFEIRVLYDGDSSPTAIHIPGKLGEPQWVVLFDIKSRFADGDLLAAQLNIPAGRKTDVYDEPIGYYTQMLPVLADFEAYLKKKGHAGASLRVGEDVGQLDMVACASPHWGPQWLGGTSQSVNAVINNCVRKNTWAMKQLLQTQPTILFLVGQSSWDMFKQSFGHLVTANPAIPAVPADGPYTLLRQTIQNDCRIEFATTIGGEAYKLSTRLVITPHFSYNENFLPQFRLSQDAWKEFAAKYADAANFLKADPRFLFQDISSAYVSAGILRDSTAVLAELNTKFASANSVLKPCFYDAHADMAGILGQLYDSGALSWTDGKGPNGSGYLSRGTGPCQFCDNVHWKFPQGCPYEKPSEKQYPIGFLEEVAQQMIASAH
jgi:hypothetical protein